MPQALIPLLVPIIGATFAPIAANLIIGAALTLGSSLLQGALAKNNTRVASPTRQAAERGQRFEIKQTVNAQSQKEFRVYGRDRVGGQIFFYAQKDNILYVGIIAGSGTIDRFESVLLYGKEVLLDSSGNVTTPPYTESGVQLVSFEFKQGYLDDPASSILTTNFPEWTAAHTLPGLPNYVARFQASSQATFQKVYQSRQPEIATILRGALVYDMRDETHDIADPSTYEWSDNNALCTFDYLRSNRGRGMGLAALDQDSFREAADYCDTVRVNTLDGVQKAFRLGGEYEVSAEPKETLATLLDTFGAELTLTAEGRIACQFGPITETPFEIDEDWIIEDEATASRPIYDQYTGLDVYYTSPEHDFTKQPAGTIVRPDLLAIRGRAVIREFYNDMVQDADQALRLAWAQTYKDNPESSGTFTLSHRGIGILFGDDFRPRRLARKPNRLFDRYDLIEIISTDTAADFSTITVTYRSYDPGAFTFNPADEGFTQPPVPNLLSQGVGIPDGATGFAHAVEVGESDIIIGVSWEKVTQDVSTQVVQWRIDDGSSDWVTVPDVAAADSSIVLTNPASVEDQDTIEVRVNRFSSEGQQSGFATYSLLVDDQPFTAVAPQSIAATGGQFLYTVTVRQADVPAAVAIQIGEGASPNWSAATRVTLGADDTHTQTFGGKAVGAYTIAARTEYIDGTYGAVITASATVTAPPPPPTVFEQTSGDGGQNSGSDGGSETDFGGSPTGDAGGGSNATSGGGIW